MDQQAVTHNEQLELERDAYGLKTKPIKLLNKDELAFLKWYEGRHFDDYIGSLNGTL